MAEAFWATLVLFVGLAQLALGAAFTFSKPSTDVTCDRIACHVVEHTLVGSTLEFTHDLATLSHSRIDHRAWVVDKQGQRFELASPSTDTALAARFQSFLDDKSQPTFAASLPGPRPPAPLFFVIGAVAILWGIKWRRGWKAQLVFDRGAGTLVIHQRPWAATRTIRLADIARVTASDRVAHTMYGNLRWEDIAVVGADGRPLWRYRTMFTRKTFQHVQESLSAMTAFLGRTGS